jgi:hypothetical protein
VRNQRCLRFDWKVVEGVHSQEKRHNFQSQYSLVVKFLSPPVLERKVRYSILLPIPQANPEHTHDFNSWTQHTKGNIKYRNWDARDDRDSQSARYFAEEDCYPSHST